MPFRLFRSFSGDGEPFPSCPIAIEGTGIPISKYYDNLCPRHMVVEYVNNHINAVLQAR